MRRGDTLSPPVMGILSSSLFLALLNSSLIFDPLNCRCGSAIIVSPKDVGIAIGRRRTVGFATKLRDDSAEIVARYVLHARDCMYRQISPSTLDTPYPFTFLLPRLSRRSARDTYIQIYMDTDADIYRFDRVPRLQYSLLYYYLAEPIFTFDTKRYKWRELLERLFELEIFGVTLRSAEGFIEFCLAIL